MRASAIPLIVLLFSLRVQGQDQENKLVNRLLRPDMTLQNSAQNKKFVAASVAQDRQVRTRSFFWKEKRHDKSFTGTREFSLSQFNSRSFTGSKSVAGLDRKSVYKSDLVFDTRTATTPGMAAESDKKADSRAFPDDRPFLGKGKSQKALSQQDKPLTIEEVRELLNKNK